MLDKLLLQRLLKELEEKLSKYENPKNSGNSSILPSQDPNRTTKSLRKKSNKKIGGQKGHKGYQLKMIAHPDKIVFHDVKYCSCCGKKLTAEDNIKARQIYDLSEIKIHVTEHSE